MFMSEICCACVGQMCFFVIFAFVFRALFGCDKQTNDLNVIETGDGSIEELGEEFSGSKIQYGWCKVTDSNTNLPKLVLINWAAPTSRKGVCQHHVNDIAGFLRGADVTINARHEGNVEEKVVLEKVSKSSGARYGFHKEKARPVEPSGPVGLVYKKADVRADIDANKRDKFWSDQEKLEKQCVQEERKVKIEEAKKRTVKSKRGRQKRQLSGERKLNVNDQLMHRKLTKGKAIVDVKKKTEHITQAGCVCRSVHEYWQVLCDASVMETSCDITD
ncbi:drebrin-like protein B isoform X2 [Corticium candelabrum]|uniref:drebrin-like protein B isoform X2 n=1 Tax=Corticium candelabrum TaxID=121492 RepID=UPI002E25BCAE|nr:drebrin-like protein B isoform X2 [Corticium candelabrum]